MPMDFFERQEQARANSRRMVLLFLLALPGVVVAVYGVSLGVFGVAWGFLAFWRSVFLDVYPWPSSTGAFVRALWQPTLFLWVTAATVLIVLCGSLYKARQLAPGGRVVALLLGGERLDPDTRKPEELRLLHVVEEMSVASGTPMPDIYVLRREFALNAFVAGHNVGDMVVCATEGCLRNLTRDEVQGVMAHEYSHILNGDMRLNLRLMALVHGLFCITLFSEWVMSRTYRQSERDIGAGADHRTGATVILDLFVLVAGFLLAFIGWNGAFFGRIIKGAVARQREFLADAAAVQFTRYPEGLANALKRVQASPDKSILRSPRAEEASHIFFCNGLEEGRWTLTATHPPLGERIQRIETMMGRSLVPGPQRREEDADAAEADLVGLVTRLLGPCAAVSDRPETRRIEARDPLVNVGVPLAGHLAYASKLLSALPDALVRAAREPRGATALVYVLLLSPIESVREAQLRALKARLSSEAGLKMSGLMSEARGWSEFVKIPLVELAFPALRRLSLAEYAALRENIAELIAADRQVDLFEFALQKMLRRHLEPAFGPVPQRAEKAGALGDLTEACSSLLSALAHAGQDSWKEAQVAFAHGATGLDKDLSRVQFRSLKDCTFQAIESALDTLAAVPMPMKKMILEACAQTVAADGRLRPREAELLRSIADSLDCPMPPFLATAGGGPREAAAPEERGNT